MACAPRGFSLIEALIALLVLSVGLLGLAQLQARLSMAASRLAASTHAQVLGASEIERSLVAVRGDREESADTQAVIDTPATRFALTNRQLPVDDLLRLEINVTWNHPAGHQDLRLTRLVNPDPNPAYQRIFLPAAR